MHAFQNVLIFGLFALLLYWQEHLSVTNISGPIYKHTHIKYGWHLWLTQWQTASHFKQIIKFPRPTCPNGRKSLTKKHVPHTHFRGAGHWWRACSSVGITEEDMQLFHAFIFLAFHLTIYFGLKRQQTVLVIMNQLKVLGLLFLTINLNRP